MVFTIDEVDIIIHVELCGAELVEPCSSSASVLHYNTQVLLSLRMSCGTYFVVCETEQPFIAASGTEVCSRKLGTLFSTVFRRIFVMA